MLLATARKTPSHGTTNKTSAAKPRKANIAKKAVSERTAEVISGLFPEITQGDRATHKFFAIFLSAV